MKRKVALNLITKIVALFLTFVLAFCCFACNQVKNDSNLSNSDSEIYDEDKYEFEHFYFETSEQMELFYDYLDNETYELEIQLPDGVENEISCFEEKVEEDFSESFFNRIPNEILLYDIDWQSVLTKYAIGTAIIVFSGILTLATLETPICYVFATAFKSAVKEALLGATIGSVLQTFIQGATSGSFNKSDATKYLIEGSADGFMWGAISGALLGAITGAKTVATPGNYFSTSGTQLIGKIDDAGNFVDDAGSIIGKARLANNGNTYVVDEAGKVRYMFVGDSRLASSEIVKAYNDINTITSVGRFAGSNLTVNGENVYRNGKLVGYLNQAGDVIGVSEYQGQLLYSINGNGQVATNAYRAVQDGITTNSVGVITNTFIPSQSDEVLVGGARVYGNYVLKDGSNAKVVQYVMDGVPDYFLMGKNDKILACLDDSLQILEGWNIKIATEANSGVKSAKEMIIKLIQNDIKYDFGQSFTKDVKRVIKETGKMPKGFQGHHINNVANNPWLAAVADNIKYYTREHHLRFGHGGKSWATPSFGNLTNLTDVFHSAFVG